MKKTFETLVTLSLVLSLAACSSPAAAEVIQSSKPRITSPAVPSTDKAALAIGNQAFAFDLYQALRQNAGNIFYSPHSISEALAMTYAGAKGDTAQQIGSTLNFTLPQDRLHPAFNSMESDLNSRGKDTQGKNGSGFTLNVVNAIWGQKNYTFLSPFLDVLAQNYGAGIRILDFITQAENSRITINNWVSNETAGRIQNLVPQGAIDAQTRMVLTNAIYFKAAWLHQFNKASTADGQFTPLSGSPVTASMMHLSESFNYAKGDGYQALELPYDGNQISMVVLLPDSGNFQPFEQGLNSQQVNSIISTFQNNRVSLTMPRFTFSSDFGLKGTLSAMGMPVAFSNNADFSGMTGSRDLQLTDVLHKAFVAVDETGTEAAAATAVIVGVTSAPVQPPVDFNINRPFIFFIRDIPTGEILFVGRILNPAA